jgi:hypothetical protein
MSHIEIWQWMPQPPSLNGNRIDLACSHDGSFENRRFRIA